MKSKHTRYQQIIISMLEEYATFKPANRPDSENQVIADTERGHFHLMRIGWDGDAFIHHTVFHFDLKPDSKIWIQANWTDTDIAAKLVELGVEKTGIVLGFQPVRYRLYTGYAVA